MKYIFKIAKFSAFTADRLRAVLPQHFALSQEGDGFVISFELAETADETIARASIQKECDRLFFLTGEQLKPTITRIENPGVGKRIISEVGCIVRGVEDLPSNLAPQKWNNRLALQLRLWQLAMAPDTPIGTKIHLLFQIIETAHPYTNDEKEYPRFDKPGDEIDPKTESKLLRHFVSHQGRPTPELTTYCTHLGLSKSFFDPSKPEHLKIIAERAHIVQEEAENIINTAITREIDF